MANSKGQAVSRVAAGADGVEGLFILVKDRAFADMGMAETAQPM